VDLVKKHEYFTGLKLEFPNLPDELIELCVTAFMKQPKTFIELHKKEQKEQKDKKHHGGRGARAGMSAAKLEELNARFLEQQAKVENKAWVEVADVATENFVKVH
jgi:hypothetical protein